MKNLGYIEFEVIEQKLDNKFKKICNTNIQKWYFEDSKKLNKAIETNKISLEFKALRTRWFYDEVK